MRTHIVTVDPREGPWEGLDELARVIDDGGLVGLPTETVYGIAVNVRDEAAMRRLAQARGRSQDAAYTVHLADVDDLARVVRGLPVAARRLAARFWPGPLTLIVSDHHGRPTAYRVPDLEATRELLRRTECRVAVAGASPASGLLATTAADVLEHFDGVLDALLDAGPSRHGAESSVVRVLPDGGAEVLREGVIPAAELREAGARTLLFVCSANRCRSPLAAAITRRLLARRQSVPEWDLERGGYRVVSAGTGCLHGAPPTPEAEAAGAARGLDLSGHRAQPLTPSLIEEADEIYVMTRAQRESILEFSPDARDRVRLVDRRGRDVPDPYGHGPSAYEKVTDALWSALRGRLDDL